MDLIPSIETPKVSLIIPCFNESPDFLGESLSSILRQTFQNFECILIDESTNTETIDKCMMICKSDIRFLYLHPKQRIGLAGSLNLGISMARGEFIARFDSDDICDPQRLALQVRFFEEHPKIDVIGSSIKIINHSGEIVGGRTYPINHNDIEKKFIFSNGMAHPTVMFRKSLLPIVGGPYDPTFRYAEDLEFWLRLLNCNIKFANLSEPLVQYRQQYTNRNRDNWKYNLKARIKNFSAPYRFKKIVGILGLSLWMYFPKKFQRFLFQFIQLRNA